MVRSCESLSSSPYYTFPLNRDTHSVVWAVGLINQTETQLEVGLLAPHPLLLPLPHGSERQAEGQIWVVGQQRSEQVSGTGVHGYALPENHFSEATERASYRDRGTSVSTIPELQIHMEEQRKGVPRQ